MDLKEQLRQYEADISKLTNIQPKQFDVAQIANMVTSIPERKWNAANAVVNGTLAVQDAKANLKTVKGVKLLEANNHKDKYSSADDRKAYAETHQATISAKNTLMNAEAELLAAKLAYECLDDLFTGAKRIMDYLIKDEQSQRQAQKYN